MFSVKEKKLLEDQLSEGLLQLKISLNDKCFKDVLLYSEELILWSQKVNLTSIKNPKDIIVKHFLDSLVCLKEIDIGPKKILDIGTGAGFPGLPLKIFRPELHISLLEARGKKIKFLEFLIDRLKMKDIEILHGRAEEISKRNEYKEVFDIVVARAVGELKLLINLSFPFLKKEGYLLALKSVGIDKELVLACSRLEQIKGKIEKAEDYRFISGWKGKLIKIKKL